MRVYEDAAAKVPAMRIGMVTALAVAVGAAGMAAALAVPAAARQPGALVSVIVQYAGGDPAAARSEIRDLGGKPGTGLHLIGGLTAAVPATALAALRGTPGISSVTADGKVSLAGKVWRADADQNSMFNITTSTGAKGIWQRKDAAGNYIDGKGIGIALIDSGIAPVKGLDDKNRIINGPDLSFESQAPNLRHLDTFGHGTHMAGIILGRDPVPATTGGSSGGWGGGNWGNGWDDSTNTDPNHFVGMAPGASLIKMKVAAA
ncbi:MAG: alkaline serine protease, partial [Actinomycetia bacterium]|nr:alkaline serine protease [Actinomycetes bacterium]